MHWSTRPSQRQSLCPVARLAVYLSLQTKRRQQWQGQPHLKRTTLASFFERTSTTTNKTHAQKDAVETELSSYLLAVCVDSGSDPRKRWRNHEANFTALSCLVKKSFFMPATSSPSERVFSCSWNTVPCHRASLQPDSVDSLVSLAQNL